MTSFSALALSLALLLEADSDGKARPPLPRSSIAAVLAHRGELGLDDAEVKQLEARDAALQHQADELRQRAGAPPGHGARRAEGPGPAEARGAPGAQSPASTALPEGLAGGAGHHGGGRGGRRPGGDAPARDPAARAAAVQTQLDDADTAAWLAAEPLLREEKREPARAVAEQYREELADRREEARRGR